MEWTYLDAFVGVYLVEGFFDFLGLHANVRGSVLALGNLPY